MATKHVARAPPKAPAMAHGACVCHIVSRVRERERHILPSRWRLPLCGSGGQCDCSQGSRCVCEFVCGCVCLCACVCACEHAQVGKRQPDGRPGSMVVLSAGSDNCVKLWRQTGALRKCVLPLPRPLYHHHHRARAVYPSFLLHQLLPHTLLLLCA